VEIARGIGVKEQDDREILPCARTLLASSRANPQILQHPAQRRMSLMPPRFERESIRQVLRERCVRHQLLQNGVSLFWLQGFECRHENFSRGLCRAHASDSRRDTAPSQARNASPKIAIARSILHDSSRNLDPQSPPDSKLPTATPNGCRGKLNRIACRVAKIDRTSAFIPFNLTFDDDSRSSQLLSPRREILRLRRERNMPGARRPMGRNMPARWGTVAGIKNQQNSIPTPEHHHQAAPPHHFQSKRLAIKPLRLSQILSIQDRLKDSARLHRDNSGIVP
jgi:hypothetical protein